MIQAPRGPAPGKTRSCPHCKAAILDSLTICPGCLHHLRFDADAAKRQVAAISALKVEGTIRHPPVEEPWEYFVVIAIRNERGEEVTRQVVSVGALQGTEKRSFSLSVDVMPAMALPKPQPAASETGRSRNLSGIAAAPPPAVAAGETGRQRTLPANPAVADTGARPGLTGREGKDANPAGGERPARQAGGYTLKPPVPGAPPPTRKG